jgi:hypothetical protein
MRKEKEEVEKRDPRWEIAPPDECFPFAWLNCTVPVVFDFDGVGTSNEI